MAGLCQASQALDGEMQVFMAISQPTKAALLLVKGRLKAPEGPRRFQLPDANLLQVQKALQTCGCPLLLRQRLQSERCWPISPQF